MELRNCKKHYQMTWHEKDDIVGWYCIKCNLEKITKRKQLNGDTVKLL